mgnify:CR=1 FL=1
MNCQNIFLKYQNLIFKFSNAIKTEDVMNMYPPVATITMLKFIHLRFHLSGKRERREQLRHIDTSLNQRIVLENCMLFLFPLAFSHIFLLFFLLLHTYFWRNTFHRDNWFLIMILIAAVLCHGENERQRKYFFFFFGKIAKEQADCRREEEFT